MNKIPKRNEVPIENTWNLQDIFESDEAWFREYENLNALTEKISAFRGKLGESAQMLLDFYKLLDDLTVRMSKFYGYASCKGDEDTGNAFYQDMRGKAMRTYASVLSAAAFSDPEIMAIPEEKIEAFYKECPSLETYRRSIYLIRRRAAHILSQESETLLAAAREMADAPDNIGSTLRNADLRFPDVTDSDGAVHQLTNGSFVPLLESSDVLFRKEVFNTYYSRLGEMKNTIAATLNAQFKQLIFFATAKKYGSTLEATLDSHEIPTEV